MSERPVACPEWQEDLAAWVMAQLPPDREAPFAAHLERCAACRAEAESLLAVAAVSLATDPDGPLEGPLPSPALGGRIVTSLAAERRRRRVARAGLALLAGAAAVVAVLVVSQDDGRSRLRGDEIAFTVVPDGAWAEAVVATDGTGSVVELTAGGLDPEMIYAFWLTPPGGSWRDRVAAGTFRPDGDGDVDVRLRCALPAEEVGRAWATTPGGDIALDTE